MSSALRFLRTSLLVFLGMFIFVQIVLRVVSRYYHFPAPPFISVLLDSPIRKALQPPAIIVNRAGIGLGMNVLELGPGPGTFTIEAARQVGRSGRVVAVDISPEMIDKLRVKMARDGATNIEAKVGNAY